MAARPKLKPYVKPARFTPMFFVRDNHTGELIGESHTHDKHCFEYIKHMLGGNKERYSVHLYNWRECLAVIGDDEPICDGKTNPKARRRAA